MGKLSFADMNRVMTDINNRAIAKKLVDAMKAKHQPLDQNQGAIGAVTYCIGCMAPNGVLAVKYPCDVIKTVNALEPYAKF